MGSKDEKLQKSTDGNKGQLLSGNVGYAAIVSRQSTI